jgi:pyrroloquinoline quinone biosynthesis protein B
VGLEITGSGRRVIYAPGAGALNPPLLARLQGADLVLFDGTFWTDDEMIALGLSGRTARQLDHLPISGPGGSLEQLAATGARCVYVHINNTNPVLLEGSPERRRVEQAGLAVGFDGMRFSL